MAKLSKFAGVVLVKTIPAKILIETSSPEEWKRTGFALREVDEPTYRERYLKRFNGNGYLRGAKFRDI